MTPSATKIDVVHVVVPARNEEALLPRCLDSIEVAGSLLQAEQPDIEISVCVVLDGCTDRSEELVRQRPSIRGLTIDSCSAGAARRHGLDDVARRTPRRSRHTTWVANTDADTLVPPHWLTAQVALAAAGIQLVVGTVVPDADDLAAAVLAEWWARHDLGESHPHVHGANLGFTLGAYLTVGGYRSVREHEDVTLVRALRDAGVPWRATDTTRVLTSGRRSDRTPGGFGRYLHHLARATTVGGIAATGAPS
ncbi:MAG: glycosyltransferase family 2 protein [Humibacillus sp.]|nr:glycosyltransferase family 2 protein [Humibacillus sp.]MDN5775716.1 glycosyltransferase family 2 protein [Humibacillus sp.]